MTVRAMKAGAVEFLTKPFDDQVLLDAIHAAIERDRERRREAAGRATLRGRVIAELTEREKPSHEARRAPGRANKQIAAELGLSVVTVQVHRGQAMRKMLAQIGCRAGAHGGPALARVVRPLARYTKV